MIRVLLADDQTVVRAGFRALLELSDDLAVVAEAADGLAAVELTRTTRPDVVLMDIRMPRSDGLEATRRIVADSALDAVRVLVLTTYEADEYVFEAPPELNTWGHPQRAGAAGFLLKDVEPDELRAAIRTVAAGRSLLAPAVIRRVIEEFARLKAPEAVARARLAPLTAASARCSRWSGGDCRTTRSAYGSSCRRSPRRPTSAGRWASWGRGTGRSWWCSRTRRGWCGPVRVRAPGTPDRAPMGRRCRSAAMSGGRFAGRGSASRGSKVVPATPPVRECASSFP